MIIIINTIISVILYYSGYTYSKNSTLFENILGAQLRILVEDFQSDAYQISQFNKEEIQTIKADEAIELKNRILNDSINKNWGVKWTATECQCQITLHFDVARDFGSLNKVIIGKEHLNYYDESLGTSKYEYTVAIYADSLNRKLPITYYELTSLRKLRLSSRYKDLDIPTEDKATMEDMDKGIFTGYDKEKEEKKYRNPNKWRTLKDIVSILECYKLMQTEYIDIPKDCAYLDSNVNMKYSVETEKYPDIYQGRLVNKVIIKLAKGSIWVALRELSIKSVSLPPLATKALSNIKDKRVWYVYEDKCLVQIRLDADEIILPQMHIAQHALRYQPSDDGLAIYVDGMCAHNVAGKNQSYYAIDVDTATGDQLLSIQLMKKIGTTGDTHARIALRKCDYPDLPVGKDLETDYLGEKLLEKQKKGILFYDEDEDDELYELSDAEKKIKEGELIKKLLKKHDEEEEKKLKELEELKKLAEDKEAMKELEKYQKELIEQKKAEQKKS